MSHDNVERVIGRLVTDEEFRLGFCEDPAAALRVLVEGGMVLNPCELRALGNLDPELIVGFADAIDPCIQKSDLHRRRA